MQNNIVAGQIGLGVIQLDKRVKKDCKFELKIIIFGCCNINKYNNE